MGNIKKNGEIIEKGIHNIEKGERKRKGETENREKGIENGEKGEIKRKKKNRKK